MPLPGTASEDEERLARHFEDIYGYLLNARVPQERLPSPWHVLSRVVKCLDNPLLKEWLDSYVELEAEPAPLPVEESPTPPRAPPKYRPGYLKALEPETSEDPQ